MTAGLTRNEDTGPRAAAAPPLEPALDAYDRVGRYRLVQQLGEGGMGVVHLAVDPQGRAVAIKVLRDHVAYDGDARARLSREVDTLSRVQDPRVAAVLDADTVGSRPYIVTRYVPGPPLDRVVADSGPLDADGLLRLGRGLVEALRAIHAAGIVHRDLKPANVLMLDREPVLIDFGIAHVTDDIRLTMTGLVMGTPGYLSPEIVEGAPVTDATDWWGWAATLAFAAQGAAPFGRGPMNVVLDRVRRGQADLSGVDPRLAPLLRAALSPEPEDRPDADQVVAALDRYAAGGEATVVVPVGGPGTTSGTHSVPVVVPRTRVMTEATAAGAVAPDEVWAPPGADSVAPPPRIWPEPAPSEDGSVAALPPPDGCAPRPQGRPGGRSPWARPAAAVAAAQALAPATPAGAAPAAGAGFDPDIDADIENEAEGAQLRPPAHPDPRIGKAARTWTLLAVLLVLGALTGVAPVVGGMAILALTWAARSTDRSMTSLVLRRYSRGGPRASDVPMAVALAPVHLVTAAVGAIAGLLLPLVVSAATVFSVAMLQALASGDTPVLDRSLPLVAGAVAGLLIAWWGPGGTSLRRGSRSIVRALTPTEMAGDVVGTLLGLLAAGLAIWAWMRHGVPTWWPLDSPSLPSLFHVPLG